MLLEDRYNVSPQNEFRVQQSSACFRSGSAVLITLIAGRLSVVVDGVAGVGCARDASSFTV